MHCFRRHREYGNCRPRFSVCLAAWVLLGTGLAAGGDGPERWTRDGPIECRPFRGTDRFPLSDQSNGGGWVADPAFSDEFQGAELDQQKWQPHMPWWKGRPPALFLPENVSVADGMLRLTMRQETVAEMADDARYEGYTSAVLMSRERTGYGYYEVRARPMASAGSSSFWFQKEADQGWLTEIDVFELSGAPDFAAIYHMNAHVFRTPEADEHQVFPGKWQAPAPLCDAFHVYGFEWTGKELTWYVDGSPVYRLENTHWHRPLYLIFDSETMPEWFGIPAAADLPSTYCVDYVRVWRKR